MVHGYLLLFGVILLLVVPTLLAWLRHHHQAVAITVLNAVVFAVPIIPALFLRFTEQIVTMSLDWYFGILLSLMAVLWLVALIWSVTATYRRPVLLSGYGRRAA